MSHLRVAVAVFVAAVALLAPSTALGAVDVRVGKELPPAPIPAGDTFMYQLIVSNAGTKPVTNVVVVDAQELLADAPNGRLEILSFYADEGSCQLLASDRLRCELGTVHPDQALSIGVTAVALSTGPARTAMSVYADQCPGQACSSDQAVVRIRQPAVELSIGAHDRVVRAGQRTRVTVYAYNPTENPISPVRSCVDLPAGLVVVRSTPKARLDHGRHCWTLPRVGATGRPVELRLTVRALPGAKPGRRTIRAAATSPSALVRAQRSIRIAAAADANPRGDGVAG